MTRTRLAQGIALLALALARPADVRATGTFQQEEKVIDRIVTLVGYFPVRIVFKTKRPGVTSVVSSTAIYHYLDGRWIFKSTTVGEGHLEGMPNVEPKLISFGLLDELFPRHVGEWNHIIKVHRAMVPDDQKSLWYDFTSVETDVLVSYAYLDHDDLLNVIEKRRMRFYREGEEGPFTRSIVVSKTIDVKEKKALPHDQAERAYTIWEERELKKVQKKEIPKVATPQDGCAWVYAQMMGSASDEDVYWSLFNMISYDENFVKHKKVLNESGEGLLKRLLDVRPKMKAQYPAKFTFVKTSPSHVYFSRDAQANGQCRLWLNDGIPVLGGLDVPLR